MAAVATQVQAASLKGRPKAFSISRNSDVSSDGTITYNSVDVDTTVGWIDASSGEFVTPDKGVYRFTFTANVLCPAKTDCTGEVSIVADDNVIAELKASQHVKVEWKGTIGAYLKGDDKSIIF